MAIIEKLYEFISGGEAEELLGLFQQALIAACTSVADVAKAVCEALKTLLPQLLTLVCALVLSQLKDLVIMALRSLAMRLWELILRLLCQLSPAEQAGAACQINNAAPPKPPAKKLESTKRLRDTLVE